MNFRLISDIVGRIIGTIENTAIASVKAIKGNTFSVRVTNAVKKVDVKGTVTVANQKKVEEQLKAIKSPVREILQTIKSVKFPKSIEVANFPKYPDFPKIPDEVSVKNFPKQEFPESFEVSNQPIGELRDIKSETSRVVSALKGLKLDPKITVQSPRPERVIVPPANVSVTQQKIDYDKLADLLASQIPNFDYEKLADTLAKEIGAMVITGSGGGGGRYAFKTESGDGAYGIVDDDRNLLTKITAMPNYALKIEEDEYNSNIRYLAVAKPGTSETEAEWMIRKIDETTGFDITYAEGVEDFAFEATNLSSYNYS